MATRDAELSIDELEQIESVCVEFEAFCQQDLRQASPADFLQRVEGQDAQGCLLVELILLKADYQLREGDWPDRAEYLNTLPSWADKIETAFSRIVGRVQNQETAPSLGPRYQVRELLGAGGMGRVYRAYDQKLNRDVAVKVLRERRGSLGARFENEIRLVASLVHPNVVSLFDFASHRGVDFAVMELIKGETLRSRLKRAQGKSIPPTLVVEWGLGVARALRAAHRLNVIHRDIKPENVMITGDGDVKVLDFGLALRELSPAEQRLTSESATVGTIPYMSPEQATGSEVSRASDVFSLGTTLIELLTGLNPFTGATTAETFRNIMERPLSGLCQPSSTPSGVWNLLERMVCKDAASRPSANEVVELLSGTRESSGGLLSESASPSGITVQSLESPTNLPRRIKELVGRDAQLEQIDARLQHTPLTTIVGAGGAGKTALAYRAARNALRAFSGGVWVCELASLQPGGDVTQSLVAALDNTEGAVAGIDEVVKRLQDQRTLVLMDNCEHVVEETARLASELLARLPLLSILATSRRPLGIEEERVLFLGGLDCERHDSDAAKLFVRCCEVRAGYHYSTDDDAAIAAIVGRLEGLPLLLELAAPKLKAMSLAELLNSLEDQLATLQNPRSAIDRQATVGQAIEWSFGLLQPEQQTRLISLSAFRASFTLEAAETLASTPNAQVWLSDLIDQSLVTRLRSSGPSRYRLLEPIRQFCDSRLDADTREALARRHASYVLEQMRAIGVKAHGPNEIEATRELNHSWADLRAATAWGRRHGSVEVAVESITHLGWMILLHSRVEAFRWLEQAESVMPDLFGNRTQAIATIGLGHWLTGDQEAAQRYADRSNEIRENAYAMLVAYSVSYVAKRFEDAVEQFRRARALAENDDEKHFQMFLSLPLDCLPLAIANPADPEVDDLLEAGRTRMLDLKWPSGLVWHTLLMAMVAGFRGEGPREKALLEQTIDRAEECGCLWLQSFAVILLEGNHGIGTHTEKLVQHLRQLEALVKGEMAAHYAVCLRSLVLAMIECDLDELAAKCVPVTNEAVGGGSNNEHHPQFPDAITELEKRLGSARFAALEAIGKTMTVGDVVACCRTATEQLTEVHGS